MISFNTNHFSYNDLVPVEGEAAIVPSQKLEVYVTVWQISQLRFLPEAWLTMSSLA